MGKKRKKNLYWTEETEQAIIEYNESDDDLLKEQLYREKLDYPLNKLAENIINRFKFPYMDETFEDVKTEVVSYIMLKLHNFSPDKGKSFGYFSIVAKNYLILQNNKKYKEHNRIISFADDSDESHSLHERLVVDPYEEYHPSERVEFIKLFIRYWDYNLDRVFKKNRDLQIAHAILELINRANLVENYNKKALYLMIREITDCQTSYITRVRKKIGEIMDEQYEEFKRTGQISDYFED